MSFASVGVDILHKADVAVVDLLVIIVLDLHDLVTRREGPAKSLDLALPAPEALGALQKAEIDKWWPIIKAAGINWGGEPGPDATEARPCNFTVGAPNQLAAP